MTEKKRILIVDDEVMILDMLEDTLAEYGYEVDTAINGKEALKLIDGNKNYDIIISDIRMPEMDGVEFFHNVLIKHPMAIFLFMTGYSDLESEEAYKNGACAYIKKPFTPKQIVDIIKKNLNTPNFFGIGM